MTDQPKKPDPSAVAKIAEAMTANGGTGKVAQVAAASKFVAEQGVDPKAEPGKDIIASYAGQKQGAIEALKGGVLVIDELRTPVAAAPSAPKAKGRTPGL